MSQTNRREFIQQSVALGAAAALPLSALPLIAAPARVRRAGDVILLGPEKIRVSRLAMGTGTHGSGGSSDQMRALGANGLADLFSAALDNGVFFWDLGNGYGSHAAARAALTVNKIRREQVTIQTKVSSRSADELRADLERIRQELGSDYIDIVLLHARRDEKWTETDKPLMDVLSEYKQKKIVRSHGISCHSIGAGEAALKSSWCEIFLNPLNPMAEKGRMNGPIDGVVAHMAKMRAAGRGVITMKVLGEGRMIPNPGVGNPGVDESLQFSFSKDVTDAITIGQASLAEHKDLVTRIEKISRGA
jgi:aryl-alcohol dehydrogenase-like predicted oxidoreductase